MNKLTAKKSRVGFRFVSREYKEKNMKIYHGWTLCFFFLSVENNTLNVKSITANNKKKNVQQLSSKGWGNFIAISKSWTNIKPINNKYINLPSVYEQNKNEKNI